MFNRKKKGNNSNAHADSDVGAKHRVSSFEVDATVVADQYRLLDGDEANGGRPTAAGYGSKKRSKNVKKQAEEEEEEEKQHAMRRANTEELAGLGSAGGKQQQVKFKPNILRIDDPMYNHLVGRGRGGGGGDPEEEEKEQKHQYQYTHTTAGGAGDGGGGGAPASLKEMLLIEQRYATKQSPFLSRTEMKAAAVAIGGGGGIKKRVLIKSLIFICIITGVILMFTTKSLSDIMDNGSIMNQWLIFAVTLIGIPFLFIINPFFKNVIIIHNLYMEHTHTHAHTHCFVLFCFLNHFVKSGRESKVRNGILRDRCCESVCRVGGR